MARHDDERLLREIGQAQNFSASETVCPRHGDRQGLAGEQLGPQGPLLGEGGTDEGHVELFAFEGHDQFLGVPLVTIDTYLVELTPAAMRGRAFAINHFVQYLAVPSLAFLAWLLIPIDPLGGAGWRWVVLIGASGALVIWALQQKLPESPRWLALQGRSAEAEAVAADMEARAQRATGRSLPPIGPVRAEVKSDATFRDIWRQPYTGRTIMMMVFNFFQTIGFFGFTNWLPALLSAQGHGFTKSLFYAFCIAWAYPITPII